MWMSNPLTNFAKRLTQSKLEGRELWHTILKDEKPHNSYTFKVIITYFYNLSCNLFNGFGISTKFSGF
jgi:hypothetical protein